MGMGTALYALLLCVSTIPHVRGQGDVGSQSMAVVAVEKREGLAHSAHVMSYFPFQDSANSSYVIGTYHDTPFVAAVDLNDLSFSLFSQLPAWEGYRATSLTRWQTPYSPEHDTFFLSVTNDNSDYHTLMLDSSFQIIGRAEDKFSELSRVGEVESGGWQNYFQQESTAVYFASKQGVGMISFTPYFDPIVNYTTAVIPTDGHITASAYNQAFAEFVVSTAEGVLSFYGGIDNSFGLRSRYSIGGRCERVLDMTLRAHDAVVVGLCAKGQQSTLVNLNGDEHTELVGVAVGVDQQTVKLTHDDSSQDVFVVGTKHYGTAISVTRVVVADGTPPSMEIVDTYELDLFAHDSFGLDGAAHVVSTFVGRPGSVGVGMLYVVLAVGDSQSHIWLSIRVGRPTSAYPLPHMRKLERRARKEPTERPQSQDDRLGLTVGFTTSPRAQTHTVGALNDFNCCIDRYAAEQIHLSFTSTPGVLSVTWSTGSVVIQEGGESPPLMVCLVKRFRKSERSETTYHNASTASYSAAGWKGFVHRGHVTLHQQEMPLLDVESYLYRVQNGDRSWSEEIEIIGGLHMVDAGRGTVGDDNDGRGGSDDDGDGDFEIAVIGDMGVDNSDDTLSLLEHEVSRGNLSFLLHVGDIAYADGDELSAILKWDAFLRKVEPVASKIPYMICTGNHEVRYNYTAFKYKWEMPQWPRFPSESPEGEFADNNLYYSFSYSHATFITFSSDHDFRSGSTQYRWLEQALLAASVRRHIHPWIIIYFHRPLYCSNEGGESDQDCRSYAHQFLEITQKSLLQRFGVDLVLTAHVHSYERVQVPNDPILYIVNGAGGCHEGLDHGWPSQPPQWSRYHISERGIGTLRVTKHSLKWKFTLASNATVIDQAIVTKDSVYG